MGYPTCRGAGQLSALVAADGADSRLSAVDEPVLLLAQAIVALATKGGEPRELAREVECAALGLGGRRVGGRAIRDGGDGDGDVQAQARAQAQARVEAPRGARSPGSRDTGGW